MVPDDSWSYFTNDQRVTMQQYNQTIEEHRRWHEEQNKVVEEEPSKKRKRK